MYSPFQKITIPRQGGYTVVREFHVWLTSASRSVWYNAAPIEHDDGQAGPTVSANEHCRRNPKLPVLELEP